MEAHDELIAWGKEGKLTYETLEVLRSEGFDSLGILEEVEPQYFAQNFKNLPKAQIFLLEKAVTKLKRNTTPMTVKKTSMPTPAQKIPEKSTCQSEGAMAIPDVDPDEEYRFLLVGKTGSGKSSSGNTILGGEFFQADPSFQSVTYTSQLKNNVFLGCAFEVMDVPGLFDTRRTEQEISADIVKAVSCMHPGPHAILYVVRLGRYTAEDFNAYKRLKALFDENVAKHLIVVFTGGDMLESSGRSLDDVMQKVPDGLNQVLIECSNRYVVFNNFADDKGPQVQRLLGQVKSMLKRTNGQPYTCPKYKPIGEGMEEEVRNRLYELEKSILQKTHFVQGLKKTTKEIEEAVKSGKERLETLEKEHEKKISIEKEKAEKKMKEITEKLKQQALDIEKKRKEEAIQHKKIELELQEKLQALEAEKQEEIRKIKEKEKEMEGLKEKPRKEERRFEKARKEEMRNLKANIVNGAEEGFITRVVRAIGNFFRW